jgi:prevent-host-death family protein
MKPMNIFDAKTDFSRLVRLVETGEEKSITIARAGKPVAMIVPFRNTNGHRFGVAKGETLYVGDFDEANDEIAALFAESAEGKL